MCSGNTNRQLAASATREPVKSATGCVQQAPDRRRPGDAQRRVRRTAAACFCLLISAASNGQQPAPTPLSAARITTDGLYKQRPAWSPDGRQLAFARLEGSALLLYVRAAEGSAERRLTDRHDSEYDAVWTPDGRRLVFSLVATSPNQGDLDVYTIAADGTDLRPVAKTMAALSHEESPSVSPDGRQVAFTSTSEGNQELYVASIDGGPRRRLTDDPALDVHPAWSPDGRRIAFATDRWGDFEIAVLDLENNAVTRLTESRGLDDYPAWSPDGAELAFTSNRDGNFEVYRLRLADGAVANLTRHEGIDNFPCWRADGRLTWVSDRDGGFDVYLSEEPLE